MQLVTQGLKILLQAISSKSHDGDVKLKMIFSRGCHGVLVVYDITDANTFEATHDLLKDIET